ncbi:MAG TPA: hypothetical protein VFN03_07300 [Trueperaceae bacterium]|nr:hypothetical protein [Trueperaceae bacterium]
MRDNRALTASMMVGIGILFLIDRFAFLSGIGNVLWALLFLIGGAVFIALYSRQPQSWWALFPGFALVAMAAAVVAGSVGGVVLLALGGAALVALYLTNRARWWALVGGGSLLSLALMAFFEGAFPRLDNAWLLFGGLAATFLLVYFGGAVRANWALFAAMAFGAFALLSLFTGRLAEAFIAFVLMGTGGYILWRESGRSADLAASAPPAQPQPEKPGGLLSRLRRGR